MLSSVYFVAAINQSLLLGRLKKFHFQKIEETLATRICPFEQVRRPIARLTEFWLQHVVQVRHSKW